MGVLAEMATCGYSVLVIAIVASVVAGKPQTVDPSVATTEEVITCDCVRQINTDVMPDVNTAINSLTTSVDELFKLANATEINPVSVKTFCLFCGWIKRYRRRIHSGHYNHHNYYHCDHHKCHHCHYHCPHCCNKRRWKRQADDGSADLPVCPIDEAVATGQTAREGTELVNNVIGGIRADPTEVSPELLDEISALYKEVNESVRNLQAAVDPNSTDCQEETVPDVAFPGEG